MEKSPVTFVIRSLLHAPTLSWMVTISLDIELFAEGRSIFRLSGMTAQPEVPGYCYSLETIVIFLSEK